MTEATGWRAASRSGFVLVVDSEPQNLILTSMMVQRLGYHACSALGVGSALEIAAATPPAVVLTELRLKGLGGLDLLERLRLKPATRETPVVIIGRDLDDGIAGKCLEAGAAAVLEKPVKVHELYQTIHPILEPGTRRRDMRIETQLNVTVDERPLDCIDGECATNLSVNGVHLRTRLPFAAGSRVHLSVTLYEDTISAKARVVYCSQDAGGMWATGLQFVDAPPEAREIIRRFIHEEVIHGMDMPGEA